VYSFRTLLEDLETICLNTVEYTIREESYCFSKITRPTQLQQSCVRFIRGFPDLSPVTEEILLIPPTAQFIAFCQRVIQVFEAKTSIQANFITPLSSPMSGGQRQEK